MGYGDDLMVTGEVLDLKKKFPSAKFVIGDGKRSYWSEIYENNKDIIRASEISNFEKVIWVNNYDLNRPYRIYNNKTDKDFYSWNLSYRAKKGKIFFTDKEKAFSQDILKNISNKITEKKIIHIEPNVKKKKGWQNRDWGFQKWQELVNKLKNKYIFIQTSFGDQLKLKNVINVHNINFRSSCVIMSLSDLFVGTEGGMHHAAAALDKKAVVIFGGFLDPRITGYNFHCNIYIENSKSPCGSKLPCNHCKECMKKISLDLITKKIEEQLSF